MPRINREKLILCLTRVIERINEVWLECKNNDLSDELFEVLEYLRLIIHTIEE